LAIQAAGRKPRSRFLAFLVETEVLSALDFGRQLALVANYDANSDKLGKSYSQSSQTAAPKNPQGHLAGPYPKSAPRGASLIAYDGLPRRDVFERLKRLIAAGPFPVEAGRTYALDEAPRAHREIGQHQLGKRRIH